MPGLAALISLGVIWACVRMITRPPHAAVTIARHVAEASEAVTSMDQTTPQNAALVEQAAAATHSPKLQAEGLMRSLAVFRVGKAAA